MPQEAKPLMSEQDELKLIYFEILDGYSFDAETQLYIRHFSDRDSALILRKREELFHYYSSQGIPHDEEVLQRAIETGEWSTDKENEILALKYAISDNEKNIANILPQQRAGFEKVIEDIRVKLQEAILERKQVLGKSIEDLIDEDINDFVVYLSFFKDKSLATRLEPTYEEFLNWESDRTMQLDRNLSFHYKKFSEANLKGISVLPLFINKLALVKENLLGFLGKPMSEYTHNQNYIVSFGIRNLNVLSMAKGNPPDLSLDGKVIDVVKWFDLQHSLQIAKKNSQD